MHSCDSYESESTVAGINTERDSIIQTLYTRRERRQARFVGQGYKYPPHIVNALKTAFSCVSVRPARYNPASSPGRRARASLCSNLILSQYVGFPGSARRFHASRADSRLVRAPPAA